MSVWPVRLSAALPDGGRILLRELRRRDEREWLEVRRRNWDWLAEWEPTPVDPQAQPLAYRAHLAGQRREAKAGRSLPWAIETDGRLVGAVHFSQITRGVLLGAAVGYWVARDQAGRGIVPLAVAVGCDYAFDHLGLHRIEVNIRPENANSLAVVDKLGFRDEGVRERFLHINGAWRDHRTFALTREDLGGATFAARLAEGYARRSAGRAGTAKPGSDHPDS